LLEMRSFSFVDGFPLDISCLEVHPLSFSTWPLLVPPSGPSRISNKLGELT
jgi:hypothetical protein